MSSLYENTIKLIEVIKKEKTQENTKKIERLLNEGVSLFGLINGNSAFREAVVRGRLDLVSYFIKCIKNKEDLNKILDKAIKGPYKEVEVDIDFGEEQVLETIYGEEIRIKIDDGERVVLESEANTLLHSVCKSKNFNIKVFYALINLGAIKYIDSINNMKQTPEVSLEDNLFISKELKQRAKEIFNRLREKRNIREFSVLEKEAYEIQSTAQQSKVAIQQPNVVVQQPNVVVQYPNMVLQQQNVLTQQQNMTISGNVDSQQNVIAAAKEVSTSRQDVVPPYQNTRDYILVPQVNASNVNKKRYIQSVDDNRKRIKKEDSKDMCM